MQPEQQGQRTGKTSPWRAVSAVLGAFIGVRKSTARDRDVASLKPVHIVVAGVIGAALFVIAIVTLVKLIT
jgi:hypothetical protein